jgi:trans-aconitate methyltransferase
MPDIKSRQSWNPESYERNAGFVADLGAGVFDLLAPKAGERILDVGCGHGKLTQKITAIGAEVIAVDASPEQVEGACARGLDARVMDARKLNFEDQFDAVFSNAALHWVKEADLVIEGVKKALVAGGRFVGEMGGAGNVARVGESIERVMERRGLKMADYWPWYFPTLADYQGRLETAGFHVGAIELFARPTPIPGDIIGWLETFGESFLADVPGGEQAAFLADVRDDLAADMQDDQGNWSVDYVRLRFQALLP